MGTQPVTTPSIRRAGLVLGALSFLVVIACVSRWRRDQPVQGWWDERGPVVPHDSFPADCSLCHQGDGWTEIRADFAFDHAGETGVPLVAAHAAAQCLRCHNDRGPVAAFAARGCAGCHADVHRGLMGADCESCHDQESWRPDAVIEIHARTRFPLIGAHAAAACWRCHPGGQSGNFAPVSAECITCHQSDLALALDPDHVAQGWVSDCDECHIPTTWAGAGFRHGTWPLSGAHKAADCTQCHVGGVFAGTPSDCVDCHLSDYVGATDPDHDALGFPTDCAQCHGTSDWDDAQFDHAGIVTGCVSCHLSDYQATTDPDHAAAGFPLECEGCHNTRTWNDAQFDHSFPIQSGTHGGFDCAECHLSPGTFDNPTCTSCHEHFCSEMNRKHDEVSGYVCVSSACIDCHPTGKQD
jgi:hypothetical protein